MSHSRMLGGIVLICFMLLYGCASTPTPVPETMQIPASGTVAVWDFDGLSPISLAQPDLGERLAAEVTEAIMRKGNFQVVERQRLLVVLEEQNLGSQTIVDEPTRLRLGRIAGAQMMIFGAYQSFGGAQTRLDLRLVDVGTGRNIKSSDKLVPSTNYQAWFEAVRQATDEML